ncbi:MAG: hypothetical protein WEC73_06025 [Chthoniobacterales bacterium]
MKHATRHVCAFLALASVAPDFAAAQSLTAPVSTVTDAVFRARWVGPQADRPELLGLVPTGEGIEPVEDIATKLREGLWLGSLRIRPGLGTGWDYSNRNSQGQQTEASDDQSFYIAPTLGLEYGRRRGPWSISARGGGGYVYYLNPNYSPNGEGSNRDPYDGTLSLGIGHSGLRHSAQLGGSASYGNGQNAQGGGDATQFRSNVTLGYSYLVNDFVTAGAYAAYDTLLTRYENSTIDDSELTNLRGGAYIDWLWTGKTTLGIKAEAGRLTQNIRQQEAVVVEEPAAEPADPTAVTAPVVATEPVTTTVLRTSENLAARQFAQVLGTVAHNLTAKVLLVGGLGASYTVDENIPDPDGRYTGVRPVYLAGLQFDPSEKTTMRLYTSFEGFDVVPSYGFSLTWRPRQTTAFTLSAYQSQNFSITTVDQFQVSRGFVAGVQQTIFSRLAVGVSGGWQQTESISLTEDESDADPYDYGFVSLSFRYSINSWASVQATAISSTGNRSDPTSSLTFPETSASVGLNLLF